MQSKSVILGTTNPFKLFSKHNLKKDYLMFANKWHPDKGGDTAVFAHIGKLYRQAEKDIESALITYISDSGKCFAYDCLKKEAFEIGETLITEDKAAYVVGKADQDLIAAAEAALKSFRFENARMKGEFLNHYLPELSESFVCEDNLIFSVRKPKHLLQLSSVLDHFNGKLEERHVAWIISRLLNLCCFLKFNGITHNGINTNNLYINPEDHKVSLLGGWFYSVKAGSKMVAVPKKTLDYAPSDLMLKKVGDYRTDLEMVKATARELLGDISGSTLYKTSVPKPMIDWLRMPCSEDPMFEFRHWYDVVLERAFGQKKWVDLDVTFFDIYGG